MELLICDPEISEALIAKRRKRGIDGHDEVWDGVYIMSPLADIEHQEVALKLVSAIQEAIGWSGGAKFHAGVNISDQEEDWTKNYRVPDATAFLPGCAAINRQTHWLGGPDWAAEIVSPGDRSRQKLDFYAKVGTRELLLIDRDPWALELYVLKKKKLKLVGSSTLEKPDTLSSTVLPLTFTLVAGEERPCVDVQQRGTEKRWMV